MKSMKNMLKNSGVRQWGGPVAHVVGRHYVGENKPLDMKLGIALFRDRRIPVAAKMLGLGAGIAAMMAWNVLELPVEALIAFFVPFGLPVEVAWNGAETFAGSLLFATLFLPHLAPKPLVAEIRAEREPALVPIPVETKR